MKYIKLLLAMSVLACLSSCQPGNSSAGELNEEEQQVLADSISMEIDGVIETLEDEAERASDEIDLLLEEL